MYAHGWRGPPLMPLYQVLLDSHARSTFTHADVPALARKDHCIVQTEQGQVFAEILEERGFMASHLAPCQVLPFVRLATEEDRKKRQRQRQVEKEAFVFCRDQARAMGLQMKVVYAHLFFDESRLLFVYTSESRVDFRELVRVLARQFHTRIEMRQVGVRDEAKLLGGYGHCGLSLCCTSHLQQFYPITIRMAKDQDMSLNPAKISGRCGRLMCCLRYEWPPRKKTPAPQAEE
jgi:cell fate regulator YaaT (PSP1 superfamily)